MSKVLGLISTSHVPAIGGAIHKGLKHDPYWKPFFDGFGKVHEWLAKHPPDLAVVAYNDHGLNFFLDKMPTFAVGAAHAYTSSDEGWGLPTVPPIAGDAKLSWDVIETLVADEFDPVSCQEMHIDHAVTIPLQLCWPDQSSPVKILPVCVNTVQHPLPSAKRCLAFGRSIGRALAAYPEAINIVVLASGGLSHQLDGARAGFINATFDAECLDAIAGDPEALAKYSNHDLVALSGTQGVEVLNWLVGRGILDGAWGAGRARETHRNYHIPISNTAAALQLLEPVAG